MPVTFKLTLTCPTHPTYTGKRKNSKVDLESEDYCNACNEVYNFQRPSWWNDPQVVIENDPQAVIEEVQHNA